jgi:hypothetical protein
MTMNGKVCDLDMMTEVNIVEKIMVGSIYSGPLDLIFMRIKFSTTLECL